jgi:exodeoxyribonuclease V beta subunit
MTPLRVARPPVLRGIRLDRSSVLEASAGTGKTYALESIVTELVLSTSIDLDRVLLVTFTERATSELRERVRAKLEALNAGRAALASDDDVRAGDFWTLDAAAQARVARALHAFDGATIATIHAFCQRVLREVAFAAGRLFEEEQVDGREAFGRAFKDVLRTVAQDETRGPWLEAALGDGWTVSSIEELLWKCALARCDLRPTFDPPALAARLTAWPGDLARNDDLHHELRAWGTHHGTAKAVVRRIAALAEIVEGASLPQYVIDAQSAKLDDLLDKIAKLAPKPGPAARICAATAELARATPSFDAALVHMLLPVVTQSLSRAKRAAGRYDFDDMLVLVDEALRGPRGPALAESMRRRWRYAFIDEFQDTDEIQWSIFRRAFLDGDVATRSVVFLVGDPKQSIYRFRGADVATYLSARGALLGWGGQRLSLERSFRATQSLVDATNAIFDAEAAAPVFTGDVTYGPVDCGRPELRLVDGDGRELSAVHLLRFEKELSVSALARVIAREIGSMTDPARPWKLDGRALAAGDAFVLTRSAREGRIVGDVFRELGVPHAFYKDDGLFQTQEASDLTSLLVAIADPSDRASRLSAWLTPFFGLPLTVVERARDLPPSHPLVARLLGWKALADAREFGRLFESILRDSGVIRREIFFGRGERALTNWLHLVELLNERAQDGHKTIDDLVNELVGLRARTRTTLDIEGNVQRLEGDGSAVQIMTIHKAKGLEAPVVFVAGGATSPPPDPVRLYRAEGRRLGWIGSPPDAVLDSVKQGDKEEDERLMYVALTRAMGRLYLPYVVEGDKAKTLRGAYDRINGRLFDLASTRADGLWTVENVVPSPPQPFTSSRDPEAWSPPEALLAPDIPHRSYGALRASRAATLATSYTRMKAERGPSGATADPAPARALDGAPDEEAASSALRSARGSGVFLHELLERVPLSSFAGAADVHAWSAQEEVASLLSEAMAAHRIPSAQRAHAAHLVWTAYTTRVGLPGGRSVERIASASRVVREMRYVFSLHHEAPARSDESSVARLDSYVRGSLDLVFEEQGLAYFVDWKSDSLPSYARDDLGLHVSEHYREQVALYALAVVKLLGAGTEAEYHARFGGLVYCFLRGMDGSGRGLWSKRPSWAEVLGWSEALRAGRSLGGKELQK